MSGIEDFRAHLAADPSVAGEFKAAASKPEIMMCMHCRNYVDTRGHRCQAWPDAAMSMGESGVSERPAAAESGGVDGHVCGADADLRKPCLAVTAEAAYGPLTRSQEVDGLAGIKPGPLSPTLPRWRVEIRSGEYYDVADVRARSMLSAFELALGSWAEDDGWPLTAAEGTITFRRLP